MREEVFPCGVCAFDEFDLLGSCPVFEFFFAGYCAADVVEVFAVDEAVNVVSGCVGFGARFAMDTYSAVDVICHANVEIPRAAGEDVDPEMVFAGLHFPRLITVLVTVK